MFGNIKINHQFARRASVYIIQMRAIHVNKINEILGNDGKWIQAIQRNLGCDLMEVNQRIKQVRNAIGLSQAKFAGRMAISSSYLAEIELNKKEATERVIRLLAVEFNVSDNWIRTGEGEMFNAEMDAQIATIVSLFKSLSQNFKSCAVNQMQELANLSSTIETTL